MLELEQKYLAPEIIRMKIYIVIAAVLMGIGVILGAMGSHMLKPVLEEAGRVSTYQTASNYLIIHALAVLVLNWSSANGIKINLHISSLCFLGGVLFFSGSLYAVSFGMTSMGMVAPIGGMAFIIGWFILAGQILISKK